MVETLSKKKTFIALMVLKQATLKCFSKWKQKTARCSLKKQP